MVVIYYFMNKDLDFLSKNYKTLEGFTMFMSRQSNYREEEQIMLHTKLLKKFFNNAKTLLYKHMNQ